MAALGGAILYYTGVGAAALEWLGEKFGVMYDAFMDVWGGIRDALAAGDLSLAMKIVWAGIGVVWQSGINYLDESWIGLKVSFMNTWQSVVQYVMNSMAKMIGGLRSIWSGFSTFFQKTWNSATGGLSKSMLSLWGLFDRTFDVEAAKQALADDVANKDSAIAKANEAAQAAIQSDIDKMLADIGAAADMTKAERDATYSAEMAKSQAALQAAKDEYESLKKQAADAANPAEEIVGDGAQTPFAQAAKNIEAAAESMKKFTLGGFAGSGGASLFAMRGGLTDRQLKIQEDAKKAAQETAANTRKMAEKLDEVDELAFAR
jgi:ElaB/YqjD/DUF883 family membrane-anchored ribosome-binding protein